MQTLADPKFEASCRRLSGRDPLQTLQAVADLDHVIVERLIRDHPEARLDGDRLDYRLLRSLWRRYERLD